VTVVNVKSASFGPLHYDISKTVNSMHSITTY